MKQINDQKASGFTLVEILIVVVILGILAAIVLPQFSNTSDIARVNSTSIMLNTIRDQIQIYRIHHNETYPTLEQVWENLSSKTNADGSLNANGEFGPYLPREPRNPYTNSTIVTAVDAGTATDGWEYNPTTGQISAVGFNEETYTYTAPE